MRSLREATRAHSMPRSAIRALPAHLQQSRGLRLVPARHDQGAHNEDALQLAHGLLHRHREQLGEARLAPVALVLPASAGKSSRVIKGPRARTAAR
jgi:hypothetical protein